jgi:Family of unknown function (DUF6084)
VPDLRIAVESAAAVPFAATPLLAFQLRITAEPSDQLIHTIALKAQIQIETTRRQYQAKEQEGLRDLFGTPDRWGQTLRSMLWTHATVMIPRFTGSTIAELQVPCTFDFNVAATKYFHALTDGDLPLCFQFSGTVFYHCENDLLQVSPISWDKESRFRLPVQAWKNLMDEHYPNSAWLALSRDAFERLQQFKFREGIPTWDEAIERALAATQDMVRS